MQHFWEAFLPNQKPCSELGPFPSLPNFAHEAVLFDLVGAFNDNINYNDLNLTVPEHMPIENMASNPVTIGLLQFLIGIYQPQYVLEIGTFIGISAIKMAQAMPYGSVVWTIEKGAEFAELAKRNVQHNQQPFIMINVFNADALETLISWKHWRRTADFVFLDADKEHYDQYLDLLQDIIRPGGILVADDVLFHGDVLKREPTTEKGKGCKRFLEKARKLSWPKMLLPLSNGIVIMQKPGEL